MSAPPWSLVGVPPALETSPACPAPRVPWPHGRLERTMLPPASAPPSHASERQQAHVTPANCPMAVKPQSGPRHCQRVPPKHVGSGALCHCHWQEQHHPECPLAQTHSTVPSETHKLGPRRQGQRLDAPPPATCSHPAAASRTEAQGQWAMGTLTTHVLQATVKWDTCSGGSPTHACRMHWASAAPHGQRPHKCHLHHTLSDGNSWPQCREDPVQNPTLRHGYFWRESGL